MAVSDDVAKPLVDPYAVPKPCYCSRSRERDIRPRFRLRCEYGHSCCHTTSKRIRCTKEDCEQVVRFHRYLRRDVDRRALLERGPAEDGEGWAPLPVIDGDSCDLGTAPRLTAEFVLARESFLEEAKGLYEVMSQVNKTEAELRQKCIHLRSREHESCLSLERDWEQMGGCLTAKDWQCDAEQDVEDLDGELKILEAEAKVQRESLLDSYFRMAALEEEGQGTIVGLDAWG